MKWFITTHFENEQLSGNHLILPTMELKGCSEKNMYLLLWLAVISRCLFGFICCRRYTIWWLMWWAHLQWLGPQSLLQYSLSQSGFWPCTGFGPPGDWEPPTLFWYSAWIWENPWRGERKKDLRWSATSQGPLMVFTFISYSLLSLFCWGDFTNHTSFTNLTSSRIHWGETSQVLNLILTDKCGTKSFLNDIRALIVF